MDRNFEALAVKVVPSKPSLCPHFALWDVSFSIFTEEHEQTKTSLAPIKQILPILGRNSTACSNTGRNLINGLLPHVQIQDSAFRLCSQYHPTSLWASRLQWPHLLKSSFLHPALFQKALNSSQELTGTRRTAQHTSSFSHDVCEWQQLGFSCGEGNWTSTSRNEVNEAKLTAAGWAHTGIYDIKTNETDLNATLSFKVFDYTEQPVYVQIYLI